MKKESIYLYNYYKEDLSIKTLSYKYNFIDYTGNGDLLIKNKSGVAIINTTELDANILEMASLLKSNNPSIPIIVIYSLCSEDNLIRSFRIGIRDFFKRPLDSKQLDITIKTLTNMNNKDIGKSNKHERSNIFLESENGLINSNFSQKKLTYPGIDRLIKFIEQHYNEDISLNLMSETACISKFHLCRLFKKQTGYSCNKYLNAIRISKAKEFLMDQSRTITDIAFSVGYSDLSHFERVFKNLVGASPNIYRKQSVNISNTTKHKNHIVPMLEKTDYYIPDYIAMLNIKKEKRLSLVS